ncbi:LacI family DNA-binding transcriptional regulator [Microbacterium arborescens]|uniref:LacI family DNA-binding transcriptional regulator n=1 Tax=Microbacterium arborescens TaxID=33883 RepID=UPI0025A0226C|nr:LacI family DNA-binding transcriptional regulator [Microbacterium arborescens]WJM16351.1 LacI family DNA-binding transcriptional regulator [Microbacterium arborescens]
MSEAMPGRARVGVRDVAAAAGVSTQTVSRVINDHPHIRPETRERVITAMSELGYRVNNAARALGTATTRTIGVIASDTDLYGPAAGIGALERAARSAGRWIATAYADGSDAGSVSAAADHLLAQGVDGIVVVAPHTAALAVLAAASLGVPVVPLHARVDAAGERASGGDRGAEGAALAVDHLLDAGHRRIAHLSGPAAWLEAVARDTGAESALARRGLQIAGQWRGDWSAGSGAALAPEIAGAIGAAAGPTAVVVANDQMALGLISGLARLGLDVPADVSVVGFDDHPDAAFYRPALTTVRLDIAGEAWRCVRILLGDASPAEPTPPRLVVRESTRGV